MTLADKSCGRRFLKRAMICLFMRISWYWDILSLTSMTFCSNGIKKVSFGSIRFLFLTFYFELKFAKIGPRSCKNSTYQPTSPNINVLHNHGSFSKTKKLTLVQ